MKLVIFLIAVGTIYGQTVVAGQASSPPQTATAVAQFKKVPKLTMTLACPGVPQDTAGNYLVIAGTSVSCSMSVNIAPSGVGGATVALTSGDQTQFTVPASVVIPAGTMVSAPFNVTATP